MKTTPLAQQLRIWVPYHNRVAREKLERKLSRLSLGWTITQAEGGWMKWSKNEVQREIISVYEVFYDTKGEVFSRVAMPVIQQLLDDGEESVLVEVNGDRYLYS